VALEPPDAARAGLAAWRDDVIAGRDDLRPVPETALHVTLVFLGWQAEGDVERIAEVAAEACAGRGPIPLAPAAVRSVPPRRPRLFALDLEDETGECGTLQAALVEALSQARLHRPERRPFWPHITLARVKARRRAQPLEAGPEGLSPFNAGRVILYRSILRPQGALYEPLRTVRLGVP
jgi:RNA 2',3'-cyclic 3'-phosphodiesterase